MSDRIAIINHGVLQQIAPPLVCYNEPANLFVAGFIGSPSMNFFEGEVVGDRLRFDSFDIDISSVEIPDSVSGLTLGIRLEDVYPANEASSIADPSQEVSTTVDVLEPVGEQIYVYLDTEEKAADIPVEAQEDDAIEGANESLLMSLDPDYRIEEGERMNVVFDRSKIHLFETQSGEAIGHGITTMEVAGDRAQAD